MKNISGALEAFRERKNEFYDYWPEEGEFDIHWECIESFLKSTLISLLDEVVVDEHPMTDTHGSRIEVIMYNTCRAELIKKINEVKK